MTAPTRVALYLTLAFAAGTLAGSSAGRHDRRELETQIAFTRARADSLSKVAAGEHRERVRADSALAQAQDALTVARGRVRFVSVPMAAAGAPMPAETVYVARAGGDSAVIIPGEIGAVYRACEVTLSACDVARQAAERETESTKQENEALRATLALMERRPRRPRVGFKTGVTVGSIGTAVLLAVLGR